MATRLEVLKQSLINKQTVIDTKYKTHFDDVEAANGQPLNDKRGGYVVLRRWNAQRNHLATLRAGIELTQRAIEREQHKQDHITATTKTLPQIILDYLASGELIQWKRYPHIFFVKGVGRGRIVYQKGEVYHRYAGSLVSAAEVAVFKEIYTRLSENINSQ